MAREVRNYPDDRVLLRAAIFDEEFSDYWLGLFDPDDRELAPYFRRLMMRLYINDKQGRELHMMDACRFIPVKHAMSAKKYIQLARKKGWIEFVDDPDDRRKTIVRPSTSLLKLVEEHVIHSAERIKSTAMALTADERAGASLGNY